MTIGIYALYWKEPDLVYIGQSVNIERRFKEHFITMRIGKHKNKHIQIVYRDYGYPDTNILEECSSEVLSIKEIEWYYQFDNLLNIADPGTTVGSGICYI